jgi:hypothetical protein
MFDFPDYPDNKRPKNLYIQTPDQEGGADQDKLLLKWKRFFTCFGAPASPGDSIEELCRNLVGESATVTVSLKHDDKYGSQNEVVLPRLS